MAGLLAGTATAIVPPAASAATPAWSITPSPSPKRATGFLSGVSCSSATSCFAVGTESGANFDVYRGVPYVGPADEVAVERWDGTTWTTVPTPDPGGQSLHAVSCTGATSCIAVGGSTSTGALAEQWDGTSWSIVSTAPPKGGSKVRLDGVSCASATSCLAVGSYSAAGKTRTLIERWDGSTWQIVASPNPTTAVTAYLNGVSCASLTSCVAVGGHVETGTDHGGALIERWDGSTWTIASTPTPTVRPTDAPLITPRLVSVSCPSDNTCFAVGYTATDALVERWDGTAWSLVATPTPATHDGIAALRDVSCSSPTDCAAVGVTFDTSLAIRGAAVPNSIAEHWDGNGWAIVARAPGVPTNRFPEQGLAQLGNLNGVSCPTATMCAAVGDSSVPERWDGTKWSLAPLTADGSYSHLEQVACPAATTCFAVGTAASFLGIDTGPLIERGDGTSWSIVPSPMPAGLAVHAALTSISCVSAADCTAVGSYDFVSTSAPNTAHGKGLILHWNGTRWSTVANPGPASQFWRLTSVSCTAATDCIAIGKSANQLLAERWNGKRWTIVTIPNINRVLLTSVSCANATFCFAVGGGDDATTSGPAPVERWNGTRWSIMPSPAAQKGMFNALNSVSCRNATDCTAVGLSQSTTLQTAAQRTLVEHWNGKQWSTVASPHPSTTGGVTLSSVSCPDAKSCTAVGRYGGAYFDDVANRPFVEQWNGTRWSIVATPDVPGAIGGFLDGVKCRAATTCAAVGGSYTRNSNFTLVEQRA